ncbi:MAG: tRNA lysidine(34) synthetase TilS [Bacteroidales bacterium]|nr:tRNA lysidine(34) synthetase TilS [Bacteroidales bacterium]
MLLLAVSGGIDSMYMLKRAGEIFAGEPFAVAHCNFHLRGVESDGDQKFVEEACEDMGLQLFVNHFDTEAFASDKGISIEMAARELRYAWFASLCREEGFRAVAVAHNANDNAETLILNLLRGTGSRGLKGMSAQSPLPGTDGKALLLRPLLDTTRAEIEAWMRRNCHQWREDSSNGDSAYKRNLIRNEIFPLFAKLNPSFLRTLGRDMEHLSQTDDIADEYYSRSAAEIVRDTATGISVSVPGLLSLEHWKYVLWRILEPYNFSFETLGKLSALLEKFRSEPRGTVTLGGKKFESPTNVLKADSRRLVIT